MNVCARSGPNLLASCLEDNLIFPLVIPPLRVEAPSPIKFFSKITTSRPARANVNAEDKPVKPQPIIATSVAEAQLAFGAGLGGASCHQ